MSTDSNSHQTRSLSAPSSPVSCRSQTKQGVDEFSFNIDISQIRSFYAASTSTQQTEKEHEKASEDMKESTLLKPLVADDDKQRWKTRFEHVREMMTRLNQLSRVGISDTVVAMSTSSGTHDSTMVGTVNEELTLANREQLSLMLINERMKTSHWKRKFEQAQNQQLALEERLHLSLTIANDQQLVINQVGPSYSRINVKHETLKYIRSEDQRKKNIFPLNNLKSDNISTEHERFINNLISGDQQRMQHCCLLLKQLSHLKRSLSEEKLCKAQLTDECQRLKDDNEQLRQSLNVSHHNIEEVHKQRSQLEDTVTDLEHRVKDLRHQLEAAKKAEQEWHKRESRMGREMLECEKLILMQQEECNKLQNKIKQINDAHVEELDERDKAIVNERDRLNEHCKQQIDHEREVWRSEALNQQRRMGMVERERDQALSRLDQIECNWAERERVMCTQLQMKLARKYNEMLSELADTQNDGTQAKSSISVPANDIWPTATNTPVPDSNNHTAFSLADQFLRDLQLAQSLDANPDPMTNGNRRNQLQSFLKQVLPSKSSTGAPPMDPRTKHD